MFKGLAQKPYEGYKLYVDFNKVEGRYYATLNHKTEPNKWMSYARYLMSVYLGRVLDNTEHVDHINEDKTDDRIDNFQILTPDQNTKKSLYKGVPTYICPICKIVFTPTRIQSGRPTPCCSRKCGGIKSAIKGSNIH